MSKYKESIAIALTITILLAIPAASDQIEIQENEETLLEEQTELENLEITLDDEEMQTTIETIDTKYQKATSHEKQIETLETSTNKLKIKQTPNASIEILETPQGKLKTGTKNGQKIEEFWGTSREELEDQKEEVIEEYEEIKEVAKENEQKAEEKQRHDIEFDIIQDGDQYVKIMNEGDSDLDLSGWQIYSENSDDLSSLEGIHSIQNIRLEPEESVKLYGERTDLEDVRIMDEIRTYSEGSTEDNLELRNNLGFTVEELNYN